MGPGEGGTGYSLTDELIQKYVLSVYYIAGIVIGTGVTEMSKTFRVWGVRQTGKQTQHKCKCPSCSTKLI